MDTNNCRHRQAKYILYRCINAQMTMSTDNLIYSQTLFLNFLPQRTKILVKPEKELRVIYRDLKRVILNTRTQLVLFLSGPDQLGCKLKFQIIAVKTVIYSWDWPFLKFKFSSRNSRKCKILERSGSSFFLTAFMHKNSALGPCHFII